MGYDDDVIWGSIFLGMRNMMKESDVKCKLNVVLSFAKRQHKKKSTTLTGRLIILKGKLNLSNYSLIYYSGLL